MPDHHGPRCQCPRCNKFAGEATFHWMRGESLHSVPKHLRSWVLFIREKVGSGENAHGYWYTCKGGSGTVSDGPSPWQENAIREYEEVRSV